MQSIECSYRILRYDQSVSGKIVFHCDFEDPTETAIFLVGPIPHAIAHKLFSIGYSCIKVEVEPDRVILFTKNGLSDGVMR